MYDLCCIGHLTHDKIVTPSDTVHMAGGTSFYFSHALKNFPLSYHLVTALSSDDAVFAEALQQEGIDLTIVPSKHTVYFENIYTSNSDDRQQKVLFEADPFKIEDLQNIQAKHFHLGPLLAHDMSADFIESLSKTATVSLDVQGFLRTVINQHVEAVDWAAKATVLPHITIIKASETEAFTITGTNNVEHAAKKLFDMGVKEVVITMGSKGSLIYDGNNIINIPAYKPAVVKDATGCGDTYMAGYLYKRFKGEDIESAGNFGAAMATIKIADSGPFNSTEEALKKIIATNDTL
nr:PfkB family carbohydrate kinase [uncultured Sediminibacterium sp.]